MIVTHTKIQVRKIVTQAMGFLASAASMQQSGTDNNNEDCDPRDTANVTCEEYVKK
jgi:hypothetical protein